MQDLIVRDRTLLHMQPDESDESYPPWDEHIAELVFGDVKLYEAKRQKCIGEIKPRADDGPDITK